MGGCKMMKQYPVPAFVLTILVCLASQMIEAQNLSVPRCSNLPAGVQMHGTAVVGNRLFVFGGETDTPGVGRSWSNQVLSAKILPNGTLDSWKSERSLPEYRAYASVEVVNNRIYVIGGSIYAGPKANENDFAYALTVLWTVIQPDGSLSQWKISQPMLQGGASCTATCSSDSQLFVIGGTSRGDGKGGKVLDTIIAADFDTEGAPRNWRQVSKLSKPLWFEGASVLDERLYVWGGLSTLDPTSVNSDVFSAPVTRQGQLGEWQREKGMPSGVYCSAFCGFNDYLIAIGGRFSGGQPTNSIWYAHLKDKRIEEWKQVNTDLEARVYHSLGLDKSQGWIFVTGGSTIHVSGQKGAPLTNAVQAFQLPQPPEAKLDLRQALAASPQAPSLDQAVAGKAPLPSSNPEDLDQALAQAQSAKKPLLAFFYSPQAPACKRFWESVASSPAFAALARSHVVAHIDVTRADQQPHCFKYSIFKVPAIVQFDSQGKAVRTSTQLRQPEDLAVFAAQP